MVVKTNNLKTVGKHALKGTNKKLVIKVPSKKLKNYKKYFKGKGKKIRRKKVTNQNHKRLQKKLHKKNQKWCSYEAFSQMEHDFPCLEITYFEQ